MKRVSTEQPAGQRGCDGNCALCTRRFDLATDLPPEGHDTALPSEQSATWRHDPPTEPGHAPHTSRPN